MTLLYVSERLASLNRNNLSNRAIIRKSEAVIENASRKMEHLDYFTNEIGYRSVILQFIKKPDILYYEAAIVSDIGHARIGIATADAEIEGPIGMDENGCSFGSKNGYLFMNGIRIRFGERCSKDDIISCISYKNDKHQSIMFFVNGIRIGNEINLTNKKKYCPAFSLFGGCTLSINTGPFFAFKETIINKMNKSLE